MAWVRGLAALGPLTAGHSAARVFGRNMAPAVPMTFHSSRSADASHIGLGKGSNKDVADFASGGRQDQRATARVVLHTGDLTHLAKPEEFDTAAEIEGRQGKGVVRARGTRLDSDDNKLYLGCFGATGTGWYSLITTACISSNRTWPRQIG